MVKRDLYMERIKEFIDKDTIKVISGIRRSGKSYFLKLIIEELRKKWSERRQYTVNRFRITSIQLHVKQERTG